MSLSTWKLENDLCRCCHAEGSFYNLSEPRSVLGQTEVYSEMLKNCFDIELPPVVGMMCTVTYTICETCVRRLRDANDFKQQVLLNEQRFRDLYKNSIKNAFNQEYGGVKDESTETFEIDVKQEYVVEENDDFHVKYESEDDLPVINIKDSQNEHLIQIKIEEKKSKSKSKAEKKPKKTKKVPKTKIIEDEVERVETVDKGKGSKGAKRHPKFSLKETDYRQDGADFVCLHCEKSYEKIHSLRFHIKSKHYQIARYMCPFCKKQFMTPAPFTLHKLEEHNVDERFRCKACSSVFNTKVQLRKHINNFHMLGEKYKCEFCDYESFSFEGMYKHKFKHKTVKDYHCKFCRKSFLRKATLDLHERIHTGDRRKVCKVCGQAFVQKASLNYHMTKYHPEVNF